MIRTGKIILPIIIMMVLAVMLSGCSTANQDSPLSLVDASGNHPDGWIAAHGQYAAPDGSLCMDCHGDDLAGGITGVSCSSDAVGCHTGGPAFHPADWVNRSATGSTWHADAYQDGLLDCAGCHTPPDLDAPAGGKCLTCHFTIGGSKTPGGWTHAPPYDNHSDFAGSPEESVCVACHEVSIKFGYVPDTCHNCHDLIIHDVEYLDHNLVVPTSGEFTAQCSFCHAITGTSPNAGAPECDTCHTEGSPYTQTNCTSCHGNPPDIDDEHGEHSGEATCDECHQGAGSGSGLNHFYDDELDLEFTAATDMVFNGSSCTGTCHEKEHENENWLK